LDVRDFLGIRGRLADIFEPVDDIECAFIFGSMARGDDRAASDIDLLAIGEARLDGAPDRGRLRASKRSSP
jgi:predicted nucleotidyltransferase